MGECTGAAVCDGAGQCAGGDPLGARALSAAGTQSVTSMQYDSAGNLVIAGTFRNTVEFGRNHSMTATGADMYVAKYAPDGSLLWSNQLPTTSNSIAIARGLGVDGVNNIVVAGNFNGNVSIAPVSYASAGGNASDSFLVAK